jgi:hypothetical protein
VSPIRVVELLKTGKDSKLRELRDRWVAIREIWVVKRKLVKVAITITGTIEVSVITLKITGVLIRVLVIATFTAAIKQTIPTVGWIWRNVREIANPTTDPT